MSVFNDSSSTIGADESFTITSDTESSSPIPKLERSLFNSYIEVYFILHIKFNLV